MRKIRVLVVDDSVVMRRILVEVASADPAIEVVGSAVNGRMAIDMVERFDPDIVTMDVEMPVMDGLTALSELRFQHAGLPVIMVSSHTKAAASVTLEALSLGANDYVAKPRHRGSVEATRNALSSELLPKIKALCADIVGNDAVGLVARKAPPGSARKPAARSRASTTVDLVAIGASTGGPAALPTLLAEFPADFPVPIVIVMHMPPLFTEQFASRLRAQCRLRVTEAQPGAVLEAGMIWVAPGGCHLTLARREAGTVIETNLEPPQNFCRPSVDVLFHSVAAGHGPASLAVVLTGMGRDGLRGCEAIHAAGGTILAQDRATSVVWGMPGFVANAGLADEVLPLDELAGRIQQICALGR